MKLSKAIELSSPNVRRSYYQSLFDTHVAADRSFMWFLIAQWIFGILCSLYISPYAWEGTRSYPHIHLWSAVLLGGAIVALPILLIYLSPGKLLTRLTVATSQMLFAALLIHLMGGRLEAHFHVFVSLALLQSYRDSRIFIPAVLVVFIDHLVRGIIWPQSVFGELAVTPWRPFEHAAWLLVEAIALSIQNRRNLAQLFSLATLQCNLAEQCDYLERRVDDRTKELNAAKVFQERILDSIEAEICILDSDGTIVFVNKPWQEFAEQNEGNLQRIGCGENYLAVCESDNGLGREQSLAIVQAVREIQAGSRRKYHWEYSCNSQSEERWFHASITPVILDGSEALAVVHVDVTAVHQARSRAAALAKLVSDSPDEVFIFGVDTFCFLEANKGACRNLGYTRDELLGMSPADIKPYYDEMQLRELMADLVDGHVDCLKFETLHQRKDGSTYNCAVSLHCSYLEGTRVVVAFVTDVTETMHLQQQLAQAKKLESIGQLAAGVAHEINTPMQCVFGNVEFLETSFEKLMHVSDKMIELLDQSDVDWEAERKCLNELREEYRYDYLRKQTPMALQESRDASRQVISVIRAMKIMAHPGSTQKVVSDIHEILSNAATLTRGRWKSVAKVDFDFDPELSSLEVLPAEISQVFLNMIVNAADSITEKLGEEPAELGQITIRTRATGEYARIEFADTGTGMSQEVLEKLFDPFFTTKEVGKGTGQGLSICHNVVVNQHGGKLNVESELGKGSSFVISLPRFLSPTAAFDTASERSAALLGSLQELVGQEN